MPDVHGYEHPDLEQLVTPDPDDDEGAPQKPSRRLGIGPLKVPTRATLRERRQLRKAAKRT